VPTSRFGVNRLVGSAACWLLLLHAVCTHAAAAQAASDVAAAAPFSLAWKGVRDTARMSAVLLAAAAVALRLSGSTQPPLAALGGAGAVAPPQSLDFGDRAPPAQRPPASTAGRGVSCGLRAVCYELLPAHFANSTNLQNRPAPYTGKPAVIDAPASRVPQSSALLDFDVLWRCCAGEYGRFYVFACRQGSTLQPTKHKGDLEAFEKAWITKDSWQSAQGYATKYPSKAVTGCASKWASTTGVGATQNHLVIILTDLGWGALGSADMGGVALHTATPTVLPDPTTKMLLGRQELGALQALVGPTPIAREAKMAGVCSGYV
jgi:hypothetical protein